MRIIGRSCVLLAGVLVVLSVGVASAFGAPAWRIESVANTTAAPGSSLSYLFEVTNTGDSPTDGSAVKLTGVLPTGLTFAGSFGAFDCSGTAMGASSISCETSSEVSPGAEGALHPVIKVTVDPLASGVLTSSFQVSGGDPSMPSASTVDPTRITPVLPGFGIDAFDAQITDDAADDLSAQAGGHPYAVSTDIDYDTIESRDHLAPNVPVGGLWPAEPMKDTIVDLPAGLTGNPTAVARCTASDLANGQGIIDQPLCPAESQVGTVFIRINGFGFGHVVTGPDPVFNMVPPPGVPARFGFAASGTVVTLNARLRSAGDYGLSVGTSDTSEGLPIAGSTVTFWGDPADPSHTPERGCPGQLPPFRGGSTCASAAQSIALLRNPTSCTPSSAGLVFGLHADSWFHPGAMNADGTPDLNDPNWKSTSIETHGPAGYPASADQWGAPVGITGCARVPFTPSIHVQPTNGAADAPTGLDVGLSVPQEALGIPARSRRRI